MGSFDTTYRTNKANRPFAVFVGFNHHQETIIFGATLMYDETIDSFTWLFEIFLEVMSSKAPKTMFTDQDATMARAISLVMKKHLSQAFYLAHDAKCIETCK